MTRADDATTIAALASAATPVYVVLGHQADMVRGALAGTNQH